MTRVRVTSVASSPQPPHCAQARSHGEHSGSVPSQKFFVPLNFIVPRKFCFLPPKTWIRAWHRTRLWSNSSRWIAAADDVRKTSIERRSVLFVTETFRSFVSAVVLTLAVKVFFSLFFQTIWPKWLNFISVISKTFRSVTGRKTKQERRIPPLKKVRQWDWLRLFIAHVKLRHQANLCKGILAKKWLQLPYGLCGVQSFHAFNSKRRKPLRERFIQAALLHQTTSINAATLSSNCFNYPRVRFDSLLFEWGLRCAFSAGKILCSMCVVFRRSRLASRVAAFVYAKRYKWSERTLACILAETLTASAKRTPPILIPRMSSLLVRQVLFQKCCKFPQSLNLWSACSPEASQLLFRGYLARRNKAKCH